MVKEHQVDGIYFRTYRDGDWFYVQWSRTNQGDWKKWPGYFMASQKTITVLKSIAKYINGRYVANTRLLPTKEGGQV